MQNLLSFDGRSNRAKFWLIPLAVDVVLIVVIGILSAVSGVTVNPDGSISNLGTGGIVAGLIVLVLWIAAFWICLAVSVKRYHDRGKSGWWVLISLVPLIGGLWFLIECGFLRGTIGPNAYGPDPLGA